MIEDLEGGTPEQSRRTHVAALSGAVAVVSLVLLFVLVVPAPRLDTPPLALSPAPSLTPRTIAFDPDGTWISWRQLTPLVYAVPLTNATTTWCAATFAPNALPQLIVFDPGGQRVAAYTTGATGESTPPRPHVWAPFTVSCDGHVFTPRIDRAR